MTETLRIPEGYTEHPYCVMSNFDHQIHVAVAEAIKGHQMSAAYTGWNFYGEVWWQDGKWCCEVWVYGSYRETFVADTLEQIQSDVCDKYGSH